MSDIKFSCPTCGQKIKCDSSHAGLRIPCPGCNGELEIPKTEPLADVAPERGPAEPAVPVGSPNAEVEQQPPSKPRPVAAQSKPSPVPQAAPEDLRCLCPVCRSELKVKSSGKKVVPTGTLPVAELVRPGSSDRFTPPPSSAPVQAKAEPPGKTPEKSSAPLPEQPREKPAHPHLGAKPRLSYILTGKPPAPLPRPDGAPRRRGQAKTLPRSASDRGGAPDASSGNES